MWFHLGIIKKIKSGGKCIKNVKELQFDVISLILPLQCKQVKLGELWN